MRQGYHMGMGFYGSYIIEDIGYSNPYTPILIERYAKCDIGTREFFDIKREIESNNVDNA